MNARFHIALAALAALAANGSFAQDPPARPLAPVPAPVEDASEAEQTPTAAAVVEVVASGEQTAQKRRSAFKVIDGGN